jgi:predicted ATPase
MFGERHNLTAYLPPLIGRAHDQETLRPLLLGGDGHLLTLTGTGGCGKTALGLALARDLLGSFSDGVWKVEMTDPNLYPTRALPIEQLAVQIDDIFRLLVGGHRATPARQQTLRAAFDWSHALLARDE